MVRNGLNDMPVPGFAKTSGEARRALEGGKPIFHNCFEYMPT